MSKHTIFLVHGMGDWNAGWSKDIQKLIKDTYSSYGPLKLLLDFDSNFEFKEIVYNDVFDSRRAAWKQNSNTVLTALKSAGLQTSALNELAKYGKGPEKDTFLATHILDVILYRFIPQIAGKVRTSVQKQIFEVLKKKPANELREWSVIGHSLGTSVVHDTLHATYTHTIPGHDFTKLKKVTRARVIAMVSNVSRVLESDADVYTSVVHPNIDPTKGVCDYFLNARHAWDPFAIPKQFRPVDDWPDMVTRLAEPDRYQSLEINAIQDKNIHSLEHYIKNPKVHVPLFRALTLPELINDELYKEARKHYEESTPLGSFDKLIKKIDKLKLGEEASWKEIIRAFVDFKKIIDDFKP